MNKNLALGLSIATILTLVTGIGLISYTYSDTGINDKIKKLNDTYTFNEDYQTIKTTYAYKEGRIKVDFETSPLPGDNPLGLYQDKEVINLKLLDKDKFDMIEIKVKGEDFNNCGNGGSVCATITKDLPATKAINITDAEITCQTEIFDSVNETIRDAFREAADMLI